MFLVATLQLKLDLAKPHRCGTGVDRAHIECKFDDRAVALERKHCPAHARFELRFELATEFAGQQAIERRAARLRQVGLAVRDFAFPLVAGQDIGISRCLDRLYVTIADAAYTEHQSVPPQFLPSLSK